MTEQDKKFKEKFSRDYPIEVYGETAYKILMNDYVRMEFSRAELKFFSELGLIDLDDPELQEILVEEGKEIPFGQPKDKTCEDILEEYQIYGFAKIKDQIENGEIISDLENEIKEEFYKQKNEIRRERMLKDPEEERDEDKDESLFAQLVR